MKYFMSILVFRITFWGPYDANSNMTSMFIILALSITLTFFIFRVDNCWTFRNSLFLNCFGQLNSFETVLRVPKLLFMILGISRYSSNRWSVIDWINVLVINRNWLFHTKHFWSIKRCTLWIITESFIG